MDVKDQLEQALEQVNRGLRTEVRETKRFARYLLKRWRHEATTPRSKKKPASSFEISYDCPHCCSSLLYQAEPSSSLDLSACFPSVYCPPHFETLGKPTIDQMSLS